MRDIKSIISEFEDCKNQYTVWIVANVADTVQNSESFIKHSNFSEFFTKAEFSSITSAISSIFGYIRIFYSELEFISYVISEKAHLDLLHTIVYNFARDGIFEGKKSLIPSFCDLFGLNYIGSNSFVVSLLRNKLVFTKYLESLKIPVPKTIIYNKNTDFNTYHFLINKPILVKNVCESASIGMGDDNIIRKWDIETITAKLNNLCNVMNTDRLLLQNYIEGIECETFVIKVNDTYTAFSPIALLIHGAEILTSDISNNNDYSFCPLSEYHNQLVCNNIIRSTEKAAKELNIKNYARFDYRVSPNGEYYLIDIAGSPYLTMHSSVAYLFTNILGYKYSDIFLLLAALTCLNQSYEVNCKSESSRPLEK